MALKRNERYPGRFSNPTTQHPQGAFKNRSAPGAQDGSYLESDWANDWDGFFARILTLAGVTANGNVDNATSSQYFDALIAAVKMSLGTAAQRDVGTGTNQVPDMSNFTSTKSTTGKQVLPSGIIRQWQQVTLASGGTCTFPTAYPTALLNFSVIHGPGATGPILPSVATANRSGLQILHNGTTNIFTVITEGY